jgi:hypothetical protein
MVNKKIDVIEISAVTLSLLFTIFISLYHISYNGFEGLSSNQWNIIWAIAENSFSLLSSGLIIIYAGSGIIRTMFKWIFIPYFITKLIYHFSLFSQIYILPKNVWENIWSFICVFLLGIGLFQCLKLIRRYRKNVAKIFKFKMV